MSISMAPGFWRRMTGITSALLLAACGGSGGGGDEDTRPPVPADPVVSIAAASAAEDSASMSFTVSLSAAATSDISVDFATSDGTATAGGDYTANTGTATITAGSTSTTVDVALLDDAELEDDETFTVTLSNASNAMLGTAAATGTITDNEVPPPELRVSDALVTEGDSGTAVLQFDVSLNSAASDDVTFDFATADDTATAPDDYEAQSGSASIAAGALSTAIAVLVQGDTDQEANETLTLTLSNVANATLATATAVGTIVDDDQPPPEAGVSLLNDTGVTFCSDGATETNCANALPGQDGQTGRDVTDNDDSNGVAGFALVKLDAAGTPLPDQSVDYATTPWACVHDEVTGLTWEVKTEDGGLHDVNDTFSRFDTSGEFAFAGLPNGGDCATSGECDSEKFAAIVNAAQLCGYSDWRLPTRAEWLLLLNFGAPAGTPMLDDNFFPYVAEQYWTRSRVPVDSDYFTINPTLGSSAPGSALAALAVQLVRGERR
ncbi:MAG: Calx-beta domain-containing protein [Pseudomonadota bacterium]